MKKFFFPPAFIIHHLPAQALKLIEHSIHLNNKTSFNLKIGSFFFVSDDKNGIIYYA